MLFPGHDLIKKKKKVDDHDASLLLLVFILILQDWYPVMVPGESPTCSRLA